MSRYAFSDHWFLLNAAATLTIAVWKLESNDSPTTISFFESRDADPNVSLEPFSFQIMSWKELLNHSWLSTAGLDKKICEWLKLSIDIDETTGLAKAADLGRARTSDANIRFNLAYLNIRLLQHRNWDALNKKGDHLSPILLMIADSASANVKER